MNKNVSSQKEVSNIGNIHYLDILKIKRNVLNDKAYQDDSTQKVDDLKDNIKKNGLIEPVIVVKNEDGNYRIISGHGRYEAIKQIYSENSEINFNGRSVTKGKIPCVISFEKFKNENDEELALIHANGRKERQKTKAHTRAEVKRIYEEKVEAHEIDPSEVSLGQFLTEQTSYSKSSCYSYAKSFETNNNVSTKKKIKPVDVVIKDIAKLLDFVTSIDIEEYGKSDRAIIKNELDKLVKLCKKIK